MDSQGNYSHSNVPVKAGGTNVSLRELVFVLFRRRWIFLAIALPIILIAGMNLLGRSGSYTAASRVLVELSDVDLPRWNISSRSIDYDREMSTFINIGLSVSVADLAAEALADSLPTIRRIDPGLVELQEGEEFRDYLLGGLDVNVIGESNILEFRHTAGNARVALMATGALRNAFIHYENLGNRNPGALDYYSEQITEIRTAIDSMLALRGNIHEELEFTSLEDELRYSTGVATDAMAQLRKAEADREQLEAEYNLLKSYLDNDPREFPMGNDQSRATNLVGWRDRVAQHEDKLALILSEYTEESTPARQQRELLAFALERLREEEAAYTQSIFLKLESLRMRESVLRRQVDEIHATNMLLPEVYQRVSVLDIDINAHRSLLSDLQGKWGEVRMSSMSDDRVSQVTALTDPELVMVLGGNKTLVYFMMVVFLAFALGVVGAYVQESLDHRIYVPHDIEENLELPVYVSITKVE